MTKIEKIKFPNGNVYEGEVKDNKPHGHGTEKYSNSAIYVGKFKNGHRDGEGTYTWSSGRWTRDNWIHAHKYIGEFKVGKMHGKGSLFYSDGSKYIGSFFNDKKNGKGTYFFNNRDRYEGEWKEDKEHGKGTYTFSEGNIEEREYREGRIIEKKEDENIDNVISLKSLKKAKVIGNRYKKSKIGNKKSLFYDYSEAFILFDKSTFVKFYNLLDEKGNIIQKKENLENVLETCPKCGEMNNYNELRENLSCCKNCDHYFDQIDEKKINKLSNILSKEGFFEFPTTYLDINLHVHFQSSRNVYYRSNQIFISTTCADELQDNQLYSSTNEDVNREALEYLNSLRTSMDLQKKTPNDSEIDQMFDSHTNINNPIIIDDGEIYPKVLGYIEIKSKELIIYYKETKEHISIQVPNGRFEISEIFSEAYYHNIKIEKELIEDIENDKDPDAGWYKDWSGEFLEKEVNHVYHFLNINLEGS